MGFITKSKSFNKEKQMKNKKDVKTNCVTVRLTERQLIALQELSKSGVCECETLASAFQYLLNQHIILKKG